MKNGKAKTVVFLNPKGGVGKSTTTMCVSSALVHRGFRTLVVDCDNQASAMGWACAADVTPFPATVVNLASYGGKVHREIQKHLDNYDFILVDTPSSLESTITQAVLLISNLAIIPLPPSPADIWAAQGILKIIAFAQTVNEDLIAYILPNRVVRTTLSKAIMKELENFSLPLMTSRLSNRTAFQEAAISGVSVSELGREAKPAADEVRALVDEILVLLGE
jgi:chromosome partitioning protein